MVCHGQIVDSLTYRIQFGHNSSVVDTARTENAVALSRFAYDLDSLRSVPEVDILDVTARGCSSWEGSYTSNLYLSRQRARTVINFVKNSFGVDMAMKESYDFESEIIDLVSESGSDYRDKVLSILKSNDTKERMTLALKSLDSGRYWEWLNSSVFPAQRRVDIVIRYSVREAVTIAPVVSEPLVIEEVPVKTEEPVTTVEPKQTEESVVLTTAAVSADTLKSVSSYLVLKNNLIYDAALVANLGVEFSIGRHFSFDLPLTFSPYNISTNMRIRTLTVQPGFRYWFGKDMSGLFASLYGNFGYYDVALCGKTRWQNSWKTPLYGGGAGVGYAKHFGKSGRWGLEFELGFGYAYLSSDCFYNVPNGALYDSYVKHYWGPTKANVGITYILRQK